MFCPNCGKEIEDNSNVCEFCSIDLNKAKIEKKKEKFSFKNFILAAGRILIDFDTALWIAAAIYVLGFCWLAIFGFLYLMKTDILKL